MKDFKDLGFHCGVDEVGRGAWSGPVVAAAVRFDKNHNITGLADSKTLSPRQRIKLYFEILEIVLMSSLKEELIKRSVLIDGFCS